MKNIYSILMTLAAAFLLAPATYAQSDPDHEKYEKFPAKHVGLNKYLKNTTPNEDGEYILRLETFTTGAVTKHAVPTDFVLVIDNSGSMLEDCLYGKTRPQYLTREQLNDPEDDYYHFLRPAHSPENLFQGISHYTYNMGYSAGNVGQAMSESGNSNSRTTWSYFTATDDSPSSSLYYYYEPDDTYYRINREEKPTDGYYRIAFTRTNGSKRYIICTQDGNTITTTTSETAPSEAYNNAANKIILIGYEGDNIYRPLIRTEELIPAYKAFIQSILDHNKTDSFADNVKKHQVSVVSFGNGLDSGSSVSNPKITPNATKSSNSRVVMGFAEITDGTGGNVESYKSVLDDSFQFRGGTSTFLGILLARKLLEAEQTKPDMAPLNSLGGTNRNKVVVFFTDGAPKAISNTGGGGGSIYNNVRLSLEHAKAIKTPRISASGSEINGKFFSINFADYEPAARFIEYISSNYPDAAAAGASNTGDMSTFTYSGTLVPVEERIYYLNANASGGLEKAFKAIADASTGDTGAHMVAVDAVSDSFALPEDIETSGKVKLFTAQCVGVKTIDGEEYLAFTDDIPVASRPDLDELWFNSVDEHGDVTWEKKTGLDIDKDVKCVIDGKTLVFKGFDFAGLWCGKDDDPDHHNTQQISEGMKNYGIADPQYRGFKLIAEFPIIIDENALGGPDVPTNIYDLSGLFPSDESGTPSGSPIVNYPKPQLTIPIKLVIQKSGLAQGESASFTIERKLIGSSDPYTLFTTFVLTGTAASANDPEIRFVSLDPRYYYRVRESGWSWAYEQADPSFLPSTENPNLGNPIVFDNDPDNDTPRHAEAKAVNRMRSFSSSNTTTIYDVVR